MTGSLQRSNAGPRRLGSKSTDLFDQCKSWARKTTLYCTIGQYYIPGTSYVVTQTQHMQKKIGKFRENKKACMISVDRYLCAYVKVIVGY